MEIESNNDLCTNISQVLEQFKLIEYDKIQTDPDDDTIFKISRVWSAENEEYLLDPLIFTIRHKKIVSLDQAETLVKMNISKNIDIIERIKIDFSLVSNICQELMN